MAQATLDTLLVRLEADLGPLRRGLASANQRIQQSTSRMRGAFGRLGNTITALGKRFATLRGGMIAVAGVAAIAAGKGIANVNARFQDLELTLETVFGGMEEGQAAMDFISTFAQRTPFDIETLSRAFIQLGGAGIQPTEELLTTFGDAAAATTNKVAAFEAMVRIATRAVGGGLGLEELEQLVNQGIPVYQILQEEIGVTRQEISEMGQSAEGAGKIMDALQTGLNKRFGGGMQRASQNLSVSMSNLGIAMTELVRGLGDGVAGVGLTGAFTFLADTLAQVAVILKPVAHLIGAVLGAAIYAVTGVMRAFTETILFLGRGLATLAEYAGDLLPDSFAATKEMLSSFNQDLDALEETMNRNITSTETMTEAQQKFDETVAGLNDQIKVAKALLAGYSQETIDALKQAGLWSKLNFDNELGEGLWDAGDGSAALGEELVDLIIAHRDLQDQLAQNTELERFDEMLQNQRNTVALLKGEIDGATTSALRYASVLAGFTGIDDTRREELLALIREEEEYRAILESRKELEEAVAEAADEEKQRQQEIAQTIADLAHQNDMLKMAIEGRTEAEMALADLEYELGTLTDEQKQRLQELRAEYEKLQATLEMQEHLQNFMKNSMEQLGKSISDNLADAVMSGKLSLDSLLDIGKQFVKQMISEFIRLAIVNQILNSIFPGAGLPTISLGKRAGGGTVNPRSPYIVGERGPEVFVPAGAGKIVPNGAMGSLSGSGGGGVTVQQTINIETGVAQTVRAEIATLLPTIKADTVKAVAEARRRGGSFAQAFGG